MANEIVVLPLKASEQLIRAEFEELSKNHIAESYKEPGGACLDLPRAE